MLSLILFVLFGAFILYAGAGVFFTDFATAVAGRSRGGPAKVAVVSSGLFGTMTGVAVANVYATGSVTIPSYKKVVKESYLFIPVIAIMYMLLNGYSPMKAAFYAIAGFIVPYMFVYNPALVTRGTLAEICFSSVTALIGVVVLAGGLQGWLLRKTGKTEKWLVIAAGIALVVPHLWVTLFGFALAAGIIGKQWVSLRAAGSQPA